MNLTPVSFLIVCPLLFLAGFVDAIGGGGGLISLPAYLFAGLPVHQAIATNKLSSSCGTCLSTARFLKHGLINLRLAVPAVAAAFGGSFLGARISLTVSEDVMKYILFIVLPLGLAGAACNMAGNWLGSGLAMHKGAKIVRPVILVVLALLLVKILTGF